MKFLLFISVAAYLILTTANAEQRFWVEVMDPAHDPFERSYLIHRHKPEGSDWQALTQFERELPASEHELELNLFYLNDLHNKLVIPDTSQGDTYVFAQMAHRIEKARQQSPDALTLFLSAGDDHTGEVYDELLGTTPDNFVISLAYHAYSQASMTAAVLGNHEFDRGSKILKSKIEQDAGFPLLSANLKRSAVLTQQHYAAAFIGDFAGARVGIIGLTSFEDTKTNLADDPELYITPQLEALQELAPELAPHVDLLIALTHIGYQTDAGTDDRAVARYLAELSVPALVVGGHSHTALYPDEQGQVDDAYIIQEVPIVQAGSWGRYLGELNIRVPVPSKPGRQAQFKANYLHATQMHVTEGNLVDTAFQQQHIAPVLAAFDNVLQEVIATAANDPALNTQNTLEKRYVGEMALANTIADAAAVRLSADIAAVNASGILAGLTPGSEVTFSDWFQVMPYADVIHILELTPKHLQLMIESNAQRLVRQDEVDQFDLTDFVSRGFLHFSNALRYEVSGNKVKNIKVHGKPLSEYPDRHRFKLALGDYIANGNQGWRGDIIGTGLPESVLGYDITQHATDNTGLLMRNEVTQYIREQGVIEVILDKRVVVD
ncbi:bifunctional metallophosphatase/5'-nucleotidase [Aliidiomarina minuta]|nr:5'-nucleotidase C-terminal domain-containing protein [Aliidiomarina minuta]